jgi:hypothetical protein
MTIEDACQQLAKRTFELDCREIRFKRQGKTPLTFGGPGNIWRDSTGSLSFKAHLAQSDFLAAWNDPLRMSLPPGELVPDDFLFKISAAGYDGVAWSGMCWPGGLSNLLVGSGTVTGTVQELKSDSYGAIKPTISEDRVWVYLPYSLDFPKITPTRTRIVTGGGVQTDTTAWDHATLEIGKEKFTVAPRDGYTEIECVFASGGIADERHRKTLESLQFALGQLMHPCAMLFVEKGLWYASLFSSDPTVCESWRQHPPLNWRTFRWDQVRVYEIAKAYYRAIANRSGDARHDLARGVFAIIRSSGAPVEASVLGVSVAVETLVDATFPELKRSSTEFIAEVERLRPNLPDLKKSDGSDLKLSEEMLGRLNGCLDTMKAKGAANAIRTLLPKLHLEQRLYDSWNILRNKYAHGGAIPLPRLGEIYDHVRNVVYLAWSIVLHSIDYNGPRTNYSLRGQPPVTVNGDIIKNPHNPPLPTPSPSTQRYEGPR